MPESLKHIHHPGVTSPGSSPLGEEYEAARALFDIQPPLVRRFLEAQANTLAEAILREVSQVRFALPNTVLLASGQEMPVPAQYREQMAGGLMTSLTRTDLRTALRQRLVELESSSDPAVTTAARLACYATARYMIHDFLPTGRSVTYVAAEGEEIPTNPVPEEDEATTALTAETDAIAEEGKEDSQSGELVVPYVPAARRFYLPQWVAFDDEGNLIVGSLQEAESFLASMQQFTGILHAAVGLAPYMVSDEEYQRKRYGILGQLVNQGRRLAVYQTTEIVRTIQQRAAAGDLNRGLSLSLPYFDDQGLQMKLRDFQVIPSGRIMFVPAFVVRGAREEQAKVAQDTRLSASTRKHLLRELEMLETAFLQDSEH